MVKNNGLDWCVPVGLSYVDMAAGFQGIAAGFHETEVYEQVELQAWLIAPPPLLLAHVTSIWPENSTQISKFGSSELRHFIMKFASKGRASIIHNARCS